MNNEDQHFWKSCFIGAIIWMIVPFIFVWMMPLLAKTTGLDQPFNFILPGISLILSAFFTSGLALLKAIFSWLMFWKRKDSEADDIEEELPKSYGSISILVTALVFMAGGAIVGTLNQNFTPIIKIYGIVGVLYGFIIYFLFQNRIFDPDDF